MPRTHRKIELIRSLFEKGLSPAAIATQLGSSRSMVERQVAKIIQEKELKGHDSWVLSTLAEGNHEAIKNLQEYFPKSLGCPIPMSPEVFEQLHLTQ